ncbi:hypothetical protein ACFL10_02030 [Patescibacteria group bacterium]
MTETEPLSPEVRLLEISSKEIKFAERVFGTHHPNTIEKRREYLELNIRALISADSPSDAFIDIFKERIRSLIDEGFGFLLDKARGSNSPTFQIFREEHLT